MSSTRALLRLARRDARRDGWRTLLVVLTVALPVAGLVGTIGLVDTMEPTGPEQATGRMGAADAVASTWQVLDDPVADLADRVASDVRMEPIVATDAELVHEGVRRSLLLTDERLDEDALAAGRVTLLDGRAAATADEVVVTRSLAEDLALAIGDQVSIDGSEVEIVGLAERPESLGAPAAFTTTDALGDRTASQVLLRAPDGASLRVTGDDVVDASSNAVWEEEPTWSVAHRASVEAERFSGSERTILLLIGGLAAVEVALIAGAAFAVSIRRRQRELGLLAAVGGTRRHLRRAVLLTGGVAGVVGSAVGVAAGIVALLAAGPWIDQLADRRTGGIALDPTWLLVSALIGLLAALAGAWWPARTASRLPVMLALAGRRPTPQPSARSVRAGLVVVVGGIVAIVGTINLPSVVGQSDALDLIVSVLLLLGCVMVVLGAGLTSPWLLERIGRLAPRLPAGPRLALRDAARFRTRNGPLVTAALAALAACVTVGSIVGSMEADARASHQPSLATDQVLLTNPGADVAARAVARELGTEPVELPYLDVEGETDVPSGVDTPRYLAPVLASPQVAEALGGAAAVEALEALDAGSVLVIGEEAGPSVRFVTYDDVGAATEVAEVPATSVPALHPELGTGGWLPDVLVPQAVVDGMAIEPDRDDGTVDGVESPGGAYGGADERWLFVLDREVDADLERRVAGTVREAAGDQVTMVVELGYRSGMQALRTVAVAVGSLAGLAIVSVAIALAATEGRRDLRTLTAVGASGRTRRSLAAGRALVLSGLAGLLAIPVGMVPAVLVTGWLSADLPVHVPWGVFAIVAIVVPLLAVAGSMLAAIRSPDRLSRAA